jgi:hypothetical protein
MRQLNMAVSSAGLRPKSYCSGKAQKQLYSNLQTRPLVREGATKLQTHNCLKEISRRKKNWSQVPDGRLTPGQIGRLTVGRRLIATATALITRLHCSFVSFSPEKKETHTHTSHFFTHDPMKDTIFFFTVQTAWRGQDRLAN